MFKQLPSIFENIFQLSKIEKIKIRSKTRSIPRSCTDYDSPAFYSLYGPKGLKQSFHNNQRMHNVEKFTKLLTVHLLSERE